jgi:hypothetical protein
VKAARSLAVVLVGLAGCTATADRPSDPPSIRTSPWPRSCDARIIHQHNVPPSTIAVRMGEFLPTWLPLGMNLIEAYGDDVRTIGGTLYMDPDCRSVEVFWFDDDHERLRGELVGPWTLIQAFIGAEGGEDGRWLVYESRVHRGHVVVRTFGLNRRQGNRVALGVIPGFGRVRSDPS